MLQLLGLGALALGLTMTLAPVANAGVVSGGLELGLRAAGSTGSAWAGVTRRETF